MPLLNADGRDTERNERIAALHRSGTRRGKIAVEFKLSPSRVSEIIRDYKDQTDYAVTLTDGITSLPVAVVKSSKGFPHVCAFLVRAYPGTFQNLELHTWKLVSGGQVLMLNDVRAGK